MIDTKEILTIIFAVVGTLFAVLVGMLLLIKEENRKNLSWLIKIPGAKIVVPMLACIVVIATIVLNLPPSTSSTELGNHVPGTTIVLIEFDETKLAQSIVDLPELIDLLISMQRRVNEVKNSSPEEQVSQTRYLNECLYVIELIMTRTEVLITRDLFESNEIEKAEEIKNHIRELEKNNPKLDLFSDAKVASFETHKFLATEK